MKVKPEWPIDQPHHNLQIKRNFLSLFFRCINSTQFLFLTVQCNERIKLLACTKNVCLRLYSIMVLHTTQHCMLLLPRQLLRRVLQAAPPPGLPAGRLTLPPSSGRKPWRRKHCLRQPYWAKLLQAGRGAGAAAAFVPFKFLSEKVS